ncbi:hypothetical protein O181_024458 [Austropuccinia psidii MF-1]|uniref:Uncharacterized protein n=1 Tax=Austropuccinia psidii MF-1 TaxID=1389203 RepID=A0A9Q3CJ00_9BASI|nr:hypothetical protein [Austropuccinia psidii MF-1]
MTRHSHFLYASQANSAATNSRPKWHLMVGGLVPQHNEQPIPGLSQPSEPHEYTLTCEPEPEVALMQSTEEPFACPATPTSVIIIDDMPIGSPLPPISPKIPTASSPHSHDEAQQEFMYLQPTFMIPQAIVHE